MQYTEGVLVPFILAFSILIAWTGENYIADNPIQLFETEEEQESGESGSEKEIEFTSEDEEELETIDIRSSFISTLNSTINLKHGFLAIQLPTNIVVFSRTKIYILFSKLLIDY